MGGYSLIEACASGRPTITYDVEWHSELIKDGETGWLIGEGDIKKISSAIKEMLKNPKLAKRIGERGKKAAFEAHNLKEIYKIRANLYDEAIKSYR
jgi:glycosyltransferase involved in cell wall biosynthesis